MNGTYINNVDYLINPTYNIHGDYIYGGPIYHHFGHTLSELVHRIVLSKMMEPSLPYLFLTVINGQKIRLSDFPAYIQEIYGFLGISDKNALVINRPSIVENLFVTESGSDFGGGPKDGYLEILNEYYDKEHISSEVKPQYDVTYVSRSPFLVGGFLGERYLENLLQESGCYIFRPEKYSFVHQMEVYKNSKLLIFPEGSACHGIELLGKLQNDCIFLNRRKTHLDIFQKILKPRFKNYYCFDKNYHLGSSIKSENNFLEHKGVSLFNIVDLMIFLRNFNINIDRPRIVAEYFCSAVNDLQEYHQLARSLNRFQFDKSKFDEMRRSINTLLLRD